MPIELGKTDEGKTVGLDIDRLVSTRMFLQANSGGGKSWAIRRLLEQTHGQVQQLVIPDEEWNIFVVWNASDPVSAWEIERDRRVHATQGNSNPYVDGSTADPTGACPWDPK